MSEERKTIYLCLAHMSEAGWEQKYVKEAFDTNWVVPMGPNVNAFEKDLEAFVNGKHDGTGALDRKVVCLSAGTAAVHLALIGCGVKAGDEVLVQSFTFCASSHPILISVRNLCSWARRARLGIWILLFWRRLSLTVRRRRANCRRLSCRWLSMVCLTALMRLWRLLTNMEFLSWRMLPKGWGLVSMDRCSVRSVSMVCCRSTVIR